MGVLMHLVVSSAVREKLEAKHGVTVAEVEECFRNRPGRYLRDARQRHKTKPATLWFIAPTDTGRSLKVIFIPRRQGSVLKSAFEPTQIEKLIYARYAIGIRRTS
jgi:hypothetical protein